MNASDETFNDQERRLLELLERQMERLHFGETVEVPEELLDDEAPRLLHCLRMLDVLAVPAVAVPAVAVPAVEFGALSPDAADVSHPSSLTHFPREFGPYVLERELGRGGMGVVYLARHRTLDAHFALKMIRTSEFASAEEIRRFFQEAQAAARLRHPGIISVHDAGEQEGLPYLVMRYVEGESLAERIKPSGSGSDARPLSVEGSARLLLAVAQAVEYLHQQGVIHRDLKPGNILIDESGNPFVTDFGLAKVFASEGERTVTGTVIGTPAYMAPEQAWGVRAVTPASDVYSLGAILYELLTGRPPFPDSNPLDQLLRLRDGDPIPPRKLNPSIPYEIEQICLRCLEKNPDHRYRSAGEFAEDLHHFLHEEPLTLQSLGFWHAFRRWTRREPALAAHLGAIATVAGIEQLVDWTSAVQRPQYPPVMTLLALWGVLSVVLQKLLTRGIPFVREAWIALDALLFTIALGYAESPVETLVVGYGLLIVASSLWYQPRLVWGVTGMAVFSYLGLLWWRGAEETPGHYPYIVIGILLVVGVIVASLVRKIRLLLHLQSQG
jgi:eukaryotic-like serine/threonine-protein kinase